MDVTPWAPDSGFIDFFQSWYSACSGGLPSSMSHRQRTCH